MGSKKPMALVEAKGLDEGIHLPIAAARALQRSSEAEPASLAELRYRIRGVCDACAWESLVDMASRREHSSAEVTRKLTCAGYSRACIERMLELAHAKRIIDDARFADSFIRSKLSCGWGRMRIERELGLRGVDCSVICGWPEAYIDEDSQLLRAKELLSRKRTPGKNAYPKLMRALVSKGYPTSIAAEAVRARLAELSEAGE